jgi:hypothetical protein
VSPVSLRKITKNSPDTFFTNGPIGNPGNELGYLETHGGGSYQPTYPPEVFLFKQNNNGTTAGNFGQFFTVNWAPATQTWTVSWDLAGTHLGFLLDGILIKTGNVGNQGIGYKFYGVSADERVSGSGSMSFADLGKNISHVSFFGSPGAFPAPDGGTTVMLLGAALGVLGMARRFLIS